MSIFKSTFKDYIKKQLQVREKSRNEEGKTLLKNINYLNARTGWIRCTSTVDIDPNSELSRNLGLSNNQLAKKYILQGGTLFNKNNNDILRRGLGSGGGAYGDSKLGGPNVNWPQGGRQELGIRPMPGITSIKIQSKSAYGSLREANINIQCWNMSQLEELELLYMRPGYDVLLEWGSTIYLDNNGNLVTIPPRPINILDVNNIKLSKTDIYKEIFKRTEESCGNYDAMYGRIKNFTWTSRPDGGFDCVVNLIGIGEVIESLKVNYSTTDINWVKSNIDKTDSSGRPLIPIELQNEIKNKYLLNKLLGTLLYLNNRLLNITDWNYKVKNYTLKLNDIPDITINYLKIKFNVGPTTDLSSNNNSIGQTYIPLKFLVAIINHDIIPYDKKNKEPYIKLSVDDENGKPLECFAHKKQVPVDPRICLISPYIKDLKNENGDAIGPNFINDALDKDFQYFKSENRGIIGNIYLNLTFLIDTINNISTNSEKGTVNLYDFLSKVMIQVQKSLCNINDFELHYDGNNDTIRIIDLKFLDDEQNRITANNTSILNVYGTENTVRTYSLQSSIFPAMSSMIAISAQQTGGVLGYNNGSLVKINEGLINRIVPTIDENKNDVSQYPTPTGPLNPITGIPVSYYEAQYRAVQEFNERQSEIVKFYEAMNSDRNILTDRIENLQNALHDIIYYEINNDPETKDSKYKGIIPVKLSLTMDGIAGIVIAQIFRIPENRLPVGYKSIGNFKVGFIITGIQQSIENNDWITTLETQTVILRNG